MLYEKEKEAGETASWNTICYCLYIWEGVYYDCKQKGGLS